MKQPVRHTIPMLQICFICKLRLQAHGKRHKTKIGELRIYWLRRCVGTHSCLLSPTMRSPAARGAVMMQVPRGAALAGAPQSLEDEVRRAGGLATLRLLHPPGLREFSRQDRAIECLQALEVSGQYASAEIGLFSREVNATGARTFIVDTHAGFALKHCPPHKSDMLPDSFYEVILEGRPCWLYFDLEFSRVANPCCNVDQTYGNHHVPGYRDIVI